MDDTRLAFTRRGYPDVDRKTCADCGTVYYSAGAHLERCPGAVTGRERQQQIEAACEFVQRGDFNDCAHAGGGRGAPLSDWCKPCLAARLSGLQDTLAALTEAGQALRDAFPDSSWQGSRERADAADEWDEAVGR